MSDYHYVISLMGYKHDAPSYRTDSGITTWAHGETRNDIYRRLLKTSAERLGIPVHETVVLLFTLEPNM